VSLKQPAFGVGLGFYILSFFLIATGDSKGPTGRNFGFECAYLALEAPLTSTPFSPASDNYAPPFLYFSTLISGLINPVFLVFVTSAPVARGRRIANSLTFAVPAMTPFCWVVFHYFEVYPREGHFLWVAGTLLVVFSARKRILDKAE
jgi:hypothetical protein